MAKREKERRVAHTTKLPNALLSKWKDLLAKTEPATLGFTLEALEKLTASQDEPLGAQIALLKEAVRSINTAINRNQFEEIRSFAEPAMSAGYFAVTDNLLRNFFIPVLESIGKNTGESNFQTYYEQYLSAENTHHTLAQQAFTVSSLLDFEIGKNVIKNTRRKTLLFLVENLEQCQEAFAKNQSDRCAEQLGKDLHHTTKALLLLFKHNRLLFSNIIHMDLNQENEDVQLFSKLLPHLYHISTDTCTYDRQCSRIASMALGATINLADDVDFVRDWIVGWIFAAEIPAKIKQLLSTLGFSPNVIVAQNWDSTNPSALLIVQGLMSTVCHEVLLEPLSKSLDLNPSLGRQLAGRSLHYALFCSVLFFSSRDDLEIRYKCTSAAALVAWLVETKNILLSCSEVSTMADTIVDALQPQNVDQLVQYVWDHWDDPVEDMQHEVHEIFDLLLSVMKIKSEVLKQQREYDDYLARLVKNLLTLDWNRKVKFALLRSLVSQLDASLFWQLEPNIIWKCLRAMDNVLRAPLIKSLLLELFFKHADKCVPGFKHDKQLTFQNIKVDCKDQTAMTAFTQWVDIWCIPILRSLTSSSELLRKKVSKSVAMPIFASCPSIFRRAIKILRDTNSKEWEILDPKYRLHAYITVLKLGRNLDLNTGNISDEDNISMEKDTIPIDILHESIHHIDEDIRIEALNLICQPLKITEAITRDEMNLIKHFLSLNMNCSSPEFRQDMGASMTKLFFRLQASMQRNNKRFRETTAYFEHNAIEAKDTDGADTEATRTWKAMEEAQAFVTWIIEHIMGSLYPGASFQRVASALKLLSAIIKVFGINESPEAGVNSEVPFMVSVVSPRNAKLLIDTLMNPYDFNRMVAFKILCQFPSPLPGLETKEDAQNLLWWGLGNVMSTRAGVSDSGAMVFRLIFTKYVNELGYDLSPEQNPQQEEARLVSNTHASVAFTGRLLDLLARQSDVAKNDLQLAAQSHPMHGVLLALQYVFRELDYGSTSIRNELKLWKEIHSRTLSLIHTVCNSVMEVLSNPSPEGNVPATFKEMQESISSFIGDDDVESHSTSSQEILSYCWRAVREASSLLDVIAIKLRESFRNSDETPVKHADLISSGVLLRTLLTTIRHRGAFSSVYPAYVSLNSCLLDAPDSTISDLPDKWLEESLASLDSSNVSITRRSAGLPMCILAIITSEHESRRKTLLEKTMKRLLQIASTVPPPDADQKFDMPQVHALNVIRAIFLDSKLGASALEYVSSGFLLTIKGFSSSSWAIRNCSVMLFSTLLQRTFGTKKDRDEHSILNKLSSREFFARFPKLYPNLISELTTAVNELAEPYGATLHTGLYPILTLLSRMRISELNALDHDISMTPFIPLVKICATSPVYKTRYMAARALVPLIPSANLLSTVVELLTFNENMTQNEIHGRVLQSQLLLREHKAYIELPKDTLTGIAQVLLEVFAVVDRLHNVTHMLLLSIVSEFFFDNSKESDEVEEVKVHELRTIVALHCKKAISLPNLNPIGSQLLRESFANVVVLDHFTNKSTQTSIQDILHLLDDADYEVRSTAMNRLRLFVQKFSVRQSLNCSDKLQTKMVQKTYNVENNLHCFALAAELLTDLNPTDPFPCEMDFSLELYWDKLLDHFTQRQSLPVIQSVLPLLGAILSQILRSTSNKCWALKCLGIWNGYISEFSRKEASLVFREAAIRSMKFVMPEIFTTHEDMTDEWETATVSTKLRVIRLLQDDNADVRDSAARVVSSAMKLSSPVHPERAVELVYLNLTKHAVDFTDLEINHLNVLRGEETLTAIYYKELSDNNVLFAKENPNIYKEDLIDIKWSAANLTKLHSTHQERFVQTIQSKFSNFPTDIIFQVISFAKAVEEKPGTPLLSCGPYGLTSRPNMFISAYRLLLALKTTMDFLKDVKTAPANAQSMMKDLRTQLDKIRHDQIHPLLWQLLHREPTPELLHKEDSESQCGQYVTLAARISGYVLNNERSS